MSLHRLLTGREAWELLFSVLTKPALCVPPFHLLPKLGSALKESVAANHEHSSLILTLCNLGLFNDPSVTL